jgi:hypothetical protein
LHESRVSQLKSQAILRLRSLMARKLPVVQPNTLSPSSEGSLPGDHSTAGRLVTVSR